VKALMADDRAYYSNIIALQPGDNAGPVQVINTLVNTRLAVNSTGAYQYQLLFQNGQLLQQGSLKTGYNVIDIKTGQKGVIIMRIFDGNQSWSARLIRH
jgi:hypothetical protein